MQFLCRSHDWTVVNHYYTQNWGLTVCFCGNAALTVCAAHCGHYAPKLARSWPCSFCAEVMIGLCKSLLHTKTGASPYVFCGNAGTHSLCPTLWPLCPKTGSVLAMQPLCRSHDWTVVNHYYTQNRGLTVWFLRQCCTHSLWPHIVATMPQNWLGLGHAVFVQKS